MRGYILANLFTGEQKEIIKAVTISAAQSYFEMTYPKMSNEWRI